MATSTKYAEISSDNLNGIFSPKITYTSNTDHRSKLNNKRCDLQSTAVEYWPVLALPGSTFKTLQFQHISSMSYLT